MDFSHNAKIQKALLLALSVFLSDVPLDFCFFHPCLSRCEFQKILILSQLTLAQVVVRNELLLHVYVTHDIRTVIFVLVDLGLKTVNSLLLLRF